MMKHLFVEFSSLRVSKQLDSFVIFNKEEEEENLFRLIGNHLKCFT